jgi:hypothetical protein
MGTRRVCSVSCPAAAPPEREACDVNSWSRIPPKYDMIVIKEAGRQNQASDTSILSPREAEPRPLAFEGTVPLLELEGVVLLLEPEVVPPLGLEGKVELHDLEVRAARLFRFSRYHSTIASRTANAAIVGPMMIPSRTLLDFPGECGGSPQTHELPSCPKTPDLTIQA